jgi:flagella basal body P-ring formation protein FlgA
MKSVGLKLTVLLFLAGLAGVSASAQTVSGSAVKDVVAAYIKESLPHSIETAIDFEDLKNSYSVGYKNCELSVTSTNSVALKGLVTFLVKARATHSERGYTQIIPVTVKIRTFQRVLIASQTISPHSEIQQDETSAVRAETTDLQNPVSSIDQLNGKWSTRWIQSGKALTFDMFADEPIVKRGQEITIMFKTKNITVRDEGSALEDGRMNDIIKVTNEYRDNLRAKVVGRGEVVLVN